MLASESDVRQAAPGPTRLPDNAGGSAGARRLLDEIERDVVGRWLGGPSSLEVDGATGRAALFADGSGVARTTWMATEKRLAFADGAFGSVVARDALAGSMEWVDVLDELLRVVAPGGRLLVTAASGEHRAAVLAVRGIVADAPFAVNDGDAHDVAVTGAELAAFAAARSITFRALVPYGATLGSLVPNRWFARPSACEMERLDRLISWIGVDGQLFAFVKFLERRFVQALSPRIGARCLVVLEKRKPTADDADESARLRQLDDDLTNGRINLAEIALRDERGTDACIAELGEHLGYVRNRVFVSALLLHARCGALWPSLAAQLPGFLWAEIENAQRRARLEELIDPLVDAWPQAFGDAFTFHGVDLGRALAPTFGRELLALLLDRP